MRQVHNWSYWAMCDIQYRDELTKQTAHLWQLTCPDVKRVFYFRGRGFLNTDYCIIKTVINRFNIFPSIILGVAKQT